MDYVVTVVDKLNATREPGTALLPKGSGLSINYPPLPATEIKGVHYIDNEQFPVPQISYELQADGTAKQGMNPASLTPTTADTDSGWLNKGYITYTLFDGSWNAPQFRAQYENGWAANRAVNKRKERQSPLSLRWIRMPLSASAGAGTATSAYTLPG